jgi:hypothetical protein
MDSPLGRAALGKDLDQEFTVKTPQGSKQYMIVDVAYAPPNAADGRKKKARPKPGESQGEL